MRFAAIVLLAAGCRSIIGIDEADIDEQLANDEDNDTIIATTVGTLSIGATGDAELHNLVVYE